jgi:hypothetical protein
LQWRQDFIKKRFTRSGDLLVLNSGSSSLKSALYAIDPDSRGTNPARHFRGQIMGLDATPHIKGGGRFQGCGGGPTPRLAMEGVTTDIRRVAPEICVVEEGLIVKETVTHTSQPNRSPKRFRGAERRGAESDLRAPALLS